MLREVKKSPLSAKSIMQIPKGFLATFSNKDFVEMIHSFQLLLDYSLFLIEHDHPKEAYTFYNFVFEKYLPENANLSNVDYSNLFSGEHKKTFEQIYKMLIDLWINLQEHWTFLSDDSKVMKILSNDITKLLMKYKSSER